MAQMMQPRMTASSVEQQTINRRLDEARVEELRKFNQDNSMLAHAASNDRRHAFQRRANDQAYMQQEIATRDRIAYTEALERKKALAGAQNEQLAAELSKRRASTIRQEIEVQRMCAESEELKSLEQSLKLAYLNKERAAQFQEQRLIRQMEEDMDQAISDKMEAERQASLRKESEKAGVLRERMESQRAALDEQMREREEIAREAAQEADRDRDMVANIVDKIEREEREEMQTYAAKREETRRMVQLGEQQRAAEMENRRRQEEAEEKEIASHMAAMERRAQKAEDEAKRKKAIADAKFRAVCKQTELQRDQEEELRQLRDMLWDEEMQAKRKEEDRKRHQAIEEGKRSMMVANEAQLKQRAEAKALAAHEEEEQIQVMMAKFKIDEEKEREAALLRAQQKEEYKKGILEQKEVRVAMYEEERAEEEAEAALLREREAYRQRVVDEARRRLLEQHAAVLEGYLPKGALQSKEELEFVRQLARQHRGEEM